LLVINQQKIIVEYLGLYDRTDKVGEVYRERFEQKLDFYSTLQDYKFVGLYPEDLKQINKILTDLKGKTF
jgi:hypothetical protein